MEKIVAYFIMLNFFIVVFRVAMIKKEETASLAGSGPFGYIWWYGMFILFLQLQMIALVFFYQLTIKTYENLVACFKNLVSSVQDFLGIVNPNAFMDWLNLSKTYWWLYKIVCFLAILWYTAGIFLILGGYLFVVLLFGPYLLGYYSIDAYKARGNSYF